MDQSISRALQDSYIFGRSHVDLSGCYYGESHATGAFVADTLDYYYFLAGMASLLRWSRVLEIGTHFGGSIFSIARGIAHCGLDTSSEIVTVDVRDRNAESFRANPSVRRILGNCFNSALAQRVANCFSGPADVLFIDIVHSYEATGRCLEQYLALVSPRVVIIDDIRLNPPMARLWTDLSARYGNDAVDITAQSHREEDVGFGLLICDRA